MAKKVSIHTPTKGVTRLLSCTSIEIRGFNPHTHEGCDDGVTRAFNSLNQVSIHTPTKGVTRLQTIPEWYKWVSIHTPTKGVTDPFRHYHIKIEVSIHTPTKGVTR